MRLLPVVALCIAITLALSACEARTLNGGTTSNEPESNWAPEGTNSIALAYTLLQITVPDASQSFANRRTCSITPEGVKITVTTNNVDHDLPHRNIVGSIMNIEGLLGQVRGIKRPMFPQDKNTKQTHYWLVKGANSNMSGLLLRAVWTPVDGDVEIIEDMTDAAHQFVAYMDANCR